MIHYHILLKYHTVFVLFGRISIGNCLWRYMMCWVVENTLIPYWIVEWMALDSFFPYFAVMLNHIIRLRPASLSLHQCYQPITRATYFTFHGWSLKPCTIPILCFTTWVWSILWNLCQPLGFDNMKIKLERRNIFVFVISGICFSPWWAYQDILMMERSMLNFSGARFDFDLVKGWKLWRI